MKSLLILFVAVTLALAGCAERVGTKEGVGTLLGAGTGALIGSQVGHGKGRLAAVAVGTLAGAFVGREVGKSLDRADRLAMANNAQKALETNRTQQPATWVNPDTGHSGTITPLKTYQSPAGEYCREYVQTVKIGDEEKKAYGTACRQPDGNWKVVE